MAYSEYIGLISCPICESKEATVHKQVRGTKKGVLYFRCYTEINGSTMRCGTIQCLGFTGQEFIKKNMVPINREPLRLPEKEEQQEFFENKKEVGFLAGFLKGEDDE